MIGRNTQFVCTLLIFHLRLCAFARALFSGDPVVTENELAKVVVDVAFQIHRKLGPGLLESVYHADRDWFLK